MFPCLLRKRTPPRFVLVCPLPVIRIVIAALWWIAGLTLLLADPAVIVLNPSSVMEGCPDSTTVGLLSVTNPTPGESYVFTLTSGAGGTDNTRFFISGNQLGVREGARLDFETQPILSVRVTATDTKDLTFSQTFTIGLTDNRLEDADGDGLSQTDEEDIHGTSDVLFDTDGDGVGDGAELAMGTSPTDPDDWPATAIIGWGDASEGVQTTPFVGNYTQLATGQNLSLALNTAGTVAAWGGQNTYGQNTVNENLQVIEVAAGGDFWLPNSAHSLSLKSDGTVVAWGYDGQGQADVPADLSPVFAVAAGRAHSLALQGDGTVVAWGANPFGNLSPPLGLSDVVAISAGGFYSLALKGDGTVVSWGSTFNGNQWEDATVPAGLSDVVAISAGRFHSLALKNDGTVVAWGYNLNGQTDVPAGLSDGVAVAAGGFHSLALKIDGSVVAWGLNSNGQTTIPVAAQSGVKTLSAGLLHSLALRSNPACPEIISSPRILSSPGGPISHQVVLANAGNANPRFSAFGLPSGLMLDPTTGILSGTLASPMRRVFQIRVQTNQGTLTQAVWLAIVDGQAPTAVLLNTQGVMENSAPGLWVGTLGAVDPDTGDTHSFELVDAPGGDDNRFFRIEGNLLLVNRTITRDFEGNPEPFSIRVRTRDSSLNTHEEVLSIPILDDRTEDHDGDGLTEAQEVDVYHTSDRHYDTDGDGFGDLFEINHGSAPDDRADAPTGAILLAWGDNQSVQSSLPSALHEVIDLAAGATHNLAVRSDGAVTAWGNNDHGQCDVPAGLQQVTAVAAGNQHSLALTHDGRVTAWGNNDLGQTAVPVDLSEVVTIAAGDSHNLALKRNGEVVVWGSNNHGQSTVPAGLSSVVAIAAGGDHSLALKNDGTVVTWGAEWDGDLVMPEDLNGIIAIAAGPSHGLALKYDGTVVAWGANDHGQAAVPANLRHVAAIAGGWRHSMALLDDGTLVAWGDNTLGQTDIPPEAAHIRKLSAGAFHNLALRMDASWPSVVNDPPIRSWPGETLARLIRVDMATPVRFSAMGLPNGLAIDPLSGWITGIVTIGARCSVRIIVDTDMGFLNRVIWCNTADGVPPTSIQLTPAILAENSPAQTTVGTLAVTDPNAGDSWSLSLTNTSDAPDNYRFYISGDRLIVRYPLTADYDTGVTQLKIRLMARDSGGNTLERGLVLQVTNDRTEDGDGDGVSQAVEEDMLGTSDSSRDDFRSADTDGDGIPNLLEYAFNLDPKLVGPPLHLGAAGNSSVGLPAITLSNPNGGQRLRIEFLRRMGSGLVYTPQFASGLNPADWVPATCPLVVTRVNADWERCVVEDAVSSTEAPRRFARVLVKYLTSDQTRDADGDGFSQAMEELLGASDSSRDDFRTADADHDGTPSIIEYAFNLDPKTPGRQVQLIAGADSTAGLPVVVLTVNAPSRRLRMEYLRRQGSQLVYTPEFASGLNPTDWLPATRPVTVTRVNDAWERCVVEDSLATAEAPKRFARVAISW